MSVQTLFSTVHLNGGGNLRTEVLTTPKLKELQRPKLVYKLPLSAATITPSFMLFRSLVMEICHQNLSPYKSACDDLYHACTFAWDKLCALVTPH